MPGLDAPAARSTFTWSFPVDLPLTLGPLRHGFGDPTIRIGSDEAWRATRTTGGPATLHLRRSDGVIEASAWGPGAADAIGSVPALLGFHDDPASFRPTHPLLADLHRRMPGLRIGRTGALFEALLPAIIEQKVVGKDARHSYQGLVRRYGERSPGPTDLTLAPAPAVLAQLPYFAFHPLGVERRRADTIRRVAVLAARLEAISHEETDEAMRLLQTIPGIGPWTAAEALRVAGGDPDLISVGDFHLPHVVAWALAREARADDARMLELLAPYRPQRGRVVRLLEAAGITPPRYGPRMTTRSIAAL